MFKKKDKGGRYSSLRFIFSLFLVSSLVQRKTHFCVQKDVLRNSTDFFFVKVANVGATLKKQTILEKP
jgi:hypothetical protein